MSVGSSGATSLWAFVIGAVALLIAFGYVKSRVTAARRRAERQKTLPFIWGPLRGGARYDVYLSDGRLFEGVALMGTSDPEDRSLPIGDWEGLLVLGLASGKRAFVRLSEVRVVVEV
ncbi:MAG: hypothetical protein O9284_10575 [Steroidobacteraceae bacterium]|nr:hypothetical protein [Steroidobacteraceae bacterium]